MLSFKSSRKRWKGFGTTHLTLSQVRHQPTAESCRKWRCIILPPSGLPAALCLCFFMCMYEDGILVSNRCSNVVSALVLLVVKYCMVPLLSDVCWPCKSETCFDAAQCFCCCITLEASTVDFKFPLQVRCRCMVFCCDMMSLDYFKPESTVLTLVERKKKIHKTINNPTNIPTFSTLGYLRAFECIN